MLDCNNYKNVYSSMVFACISDHLVYLTFIKSCKLTIIIGNTLCTIKQSYELGQNSLEHLRADKLSVYKSLATLPL